MSDGAVTADAELTDAQGRQLFSTPEIAQKLDLLRHLTDNSERIVVMRGSEGLGKSTLFQRYQEMARKEWVVCPVVSNPMLHPEQLFSQLGRCFGVAGEDDNVVELLLERFEVLHDEGCPPVVVIDDAHLLPVATIIALLRLYERRTGESALVRIILFALPQIDDLLRTPQIQAMNLQVLQMLELPAFSHQQSRDFIGFIGGSGVETGAVFDEGEIERIVRVSKGVPGEIEAQVLGSMRERTTAEVSDAESDDIAELVEPGRSGVLPLPVILGGGGVAILLILTLLFQDSINAFFEDKKPASETVEIALPEQAVDQPVVAGDLPVTEPITRPPEVTPPEAEQVMSPVPTPETVIDEEVSEEGLGDVAAEVLATEAESPIPVEAVPGSEAGSEPEQAPESEGVDESVGSSEPREAEDPDATPEVVPEPQAVAPEVIAAEPVIEKTPLVEVPKPEAPKGHAWLQVQNPGAYTLQLIGVQSESAATEFVSQHKLGSDSAIFKTARQGKPWYSVVYGVYANRGAAVTAREKLPPALRNYSPWPRSFASIQQLLK